MCHGELNSTLTKKPNDISISSHEAGCCVQSAEEEVVSRDLCREALVGWAGLNAKVRLSVGLWGWKEKQAQPLKWICPSEYAAAVLQHYQCMSSLQDMHGAVV